MDAPPQIGFVFFRATDVCVADPSLFKTVRDAVQDKWGDIVEAQYWGQAVERPDRFYWVVFWNTPEAYAKFKEEAHITEFMSRFALIQLEHKPFLDLVFTNPLRPLLASPICEVTCSHLRKDSVQEDLAEQMQQIVDLQTSRGYKGSRDSSWTLTPERGGNLVHISGWDSIEDHMVLGVDDEEYLARAEAIMDMLAEVQMFHVRFEQH